MHWETEKNRVVPFFAILARLQWVGNRTCVISKVMPVVRKEKGKYKTCRLLLELLLEASSGPSVMVMTPGEDKQRRQQPWNSGSFLVKELESNI